MKFDINENQLQVISVALSKLPYEYSAPVIRELQNQIDMQLKQPGEASE